VYTPSIRGIHAAAQSPSALLTSQLVPIIATPATAVPIAAQVCPSTISRNNSQPSRAAENGAKLCKKSVVAASIRAIDTMKAVDIHASRAPESKFLEKPARRILTGRELDPPANATNEAIRIPTERQNRNSHSELSSEVQRNSNGLKLKSVPAKRTNNDPFLSLRRCRTSRDCHDWWFKPTRM